MVSYMCQRQSSATRLPSAALMPPWAATVWLRVGGTLERQATDAPRSLPQPPHAARPPRTDNQHVMMVVGKGIGLVISR